MSSIRRYGRAWSASNGVWGGKGEADGRWHVSHHDEASRGERTTWTANAKQKEKGRERERERDPERDGERETEIKKETSREIKKERSREIKRDEER